MTEEEKNRIISDYEFQKKFDKWWLIFSCGIGLFICGYVTGRLTAVKDLQDGKLDMFIPKR